MTCIVGLAQEGKVWIGGDSAGVGGYDLTVRADVKVFTNSAFIFGFTSSFRMGQLLRYALSPPNIYGRDLMTYMCTDFIDAVRNCLKSGGYASKDKEQEEGGCFLVGTAGRLFTIYSDYQVGESIARYDAVGCGHAYASGVMYATAAERGIVMDPEARLRMALGCAEAHSAGVRAPFTMLSV